MKLLFVVLPPLAAGVDADELPLLLLLLLVDVAVVELEEELELLVGEVGEGEEVVVLEDVGGEEECLFLRWTKQHGSAR